MIAGKDRAEARAEIAVERQMVAVMPRRPERHEPPAVALDHLAILQRVIGDEVHIHSLAPAKPALFGEAAHHLGLAAGRRTIGQNRGAGCLGQRTGEGGVIAMGMGGQDMADVLPRPERREDRRHMGLIQRAGIDHGDPGTLADQVGIRPAEGEGGGVVAQDAPDAGQDLFGHFWGGVEFVGVAHVLVLWFFRSSRDRRQWIGGTVAMDFDWLKRYVPRGLYGRAALILMLPVVVIQLVVSVVFIQRHFEDVTTQMTRSLSRELRLLADSPAPERGALAAALELTVLEGAAQTDEDIRRWYDLSGVSVIRTLRQELPELHTVELPDDHVVRVHLERDPPLTMEFWRGRVSASNPHQLLVNMVFFGGLMTLVAYLYLRNQLRPITRLAAAAEAFGKGQTVPYRPGGATEVRAAGQAFLSMRNRIERQIEQRTLMLSGVSHDLRTPLTRLKLGLSMLEDEDRIPLQKDVEEMQGMIEEFLDFARGTASEQVEEADPLELVRNIVADAARGGIAVTLEEVEGEGKVRLRPHALRRAVENLISNAVRYGTHAEVSVQISEKALRIRVEDDGPGIPPDRREEATRPFARLEPARNQNRGSGVGLGLAIATDIAGTHGGVLRLGTSEKLGGLQADIVFAR